MIALVVLGVAGYWGYDLYRDKQQVEVYLGNKYQQSFYELVDRVEQLQVLLGKSLVSTSPRQNIIILTDIWSYANTAQAELNQLPLAASNVYQTAKFLSQAGDYAHVMAKNNAEGRVLTEENRSKLNQLRQEATQIGETLHELENQIFSGDINWTDMVRGASTRLRNEGEDPVGDGFADITEELNKFPTLIYDGPFSDHVTEAKPKGLEGNTVSIAQAKNKAIKAVDFLNERDISASDGTSVNGRIPSFNFQVKNGEDEGVYSVDISEKGGHLVNMISNRSVPNSRISQPEAAGKAKDYLAVQGYPKMEPTYSEVDRNVAYISFAYKDDDIIFYPDIINVQVALDNGQVLAVEALSYLMSHHKRDLSEPEISQDEARSMAENTLENIENIRLAVIPQADLNDVLTYEIRGDVGGETYIIYINADTGEEEQILQVIKGEGGTFTL